jgi:hypothetical protein
MSKIALTPDVDGTGTLSIVSPNTNTNRTLTLPDETSTLAILGANTFTGAQTFSLFPTISALSYIRLNTANGYGSTNTKIRRFTNIVSNVGSDITYADSATLGGSFTINTDGVYSVAFGDIFVGLELMGLSINSTELTTDINSITATNILSVTTAPGANQPSVAVATFYASDGDVVRAHTRGVSVGAGDPTSCQFTMARVA